MDYCDCFRILELIEKAVGSRLTLTIHIQRIVEERLTARMRQTDGTSGANSTMRAGNTKEGGRRKVAEEKYK